MSESIAISATVNGRERTFAVEAHQTLLDSLRNDLGLTGTKECCLVGECGACTVVIDGRSVDSCLMLAAEADGRSIETVEGLARGSPGSLTVLQQAFLDTGAAQCGFCIPGQLMSAHVLLELTPHPTRAEIEEGLAGNLCRCAGYEQIIEAVQQAAEAGADGHADVAGERGRRGSSRPEPSVDVASLPDARVAPQ